MNDVHVLLVDDNAVELERCREALSTIPRCSVVTEGKSAAALKLLGSGSFDLVVTDLRMPMVDGLDILRVANSVDPDLPVVILTGYPSVDTAVSALREGAADYLSKPVNLEELVMVASRLLEMRRIRGEHRLLERRVDRDYAFGEMIGISEAMRGVFEAVRRLASSDVDVLIVGETGTGKELVARSLHRQSTARSGRFVPVDCGAIPESLMESELFGHERGAFTGADRKSIGLMEFANGGTFFLDEVNALPLSMQAKLLRSLEERRIRRVGSTRETEVDIRVVAAANEDLAALVEDGRFREDLYYRLNVGRVALPPLRDRTDDVPLLVEHFLDRHQGAEDRRVVDVSEDALQLLVGFGWPGNIRQLRNVVRRALVTASGPLLTPHDLPDEVRSEGPRGTSLAAGPLFELRAEHQERFEKDYLVARLRECLGDVSEAARRAEVPRGTFYRLMKKHDLNAERFRSRS
jgi:DNA-binding NtrC family response regulator